MEKLYFNLHHRIDDGFSGMHGHGVVTITIVEPSTTNPGHYTTPGNELTNDVEYAGLTIRAQWNRKADDCALYGADIGYDTDGQTIRLWELERKVKFLRKIHRKLDKLTADFDYPTTFEDCMRRYAKAFGVVGAIEYAHGTADVMSMVRFFGRVAELVKGSVPAEGVA